MVEKNNLLIDINDVAHLFNKDYVPKENLLVVGGSSETPSPPFLASMAAKHCGAKSTTIASTKEVLKLAKASGTQRFVPLEDFSQESFKNKVIPDLRKKQYPAIHIGPGFSSRKEDLEGIKYFIKKIPKNKVLILDANALDILINSQDFLK